MEIAAWVWSVEHPQGLRPKKLKKVIDISRKFGKNHCMGLVCGTPTRFMPAVAAARTAQATTITPALGAGVKKESFVSEKRRLSTYWSNIADDVTCGDSKKI